MGWAARVNFVSMGLLSIAEELVRYGHQTRIVHVGVEKLLNRNWSLIRYLRDSGTQVVAFALHWHPQTYDTLVLAKQVKEALPHLQVVLGGLTAGYFAKDILENFPVDVVIRGEGERPLARLVEAVKNGKAFDDIPNISWRSNGQLKHNAQTFLTTGEDMDTWSFSGFSLMENADTYLRLDWRLPWEPELAAKRLNPTPTIFGLAMGRGCLGTCTWCAGSYGTTKAATGRKKTAWRRAERIAETIAAARDQGVQRFYSCFDPHPKKTEELLHLFKLLGAMTPRVSLDFEAFSLPQPEVLEAFMDNLAPDSAMILSPETSNESLRKDHRAFPFSNQELEACLDRLEENNWPSLLYFIIGLPSETRADILETAAYQQMLKGRYSKISKIFTWPLEMEPNSPWFNEPERFNIRLRHRTLRDFYRAHRAPDFSLGYDSSHLREMEILALRNEHFMGVPSEKLQPIKAYWAANRRDHSMVRAHRN